MCLCVCMCACVCACICGVQWREFGGGVGWRKPCWNLCQGMLRLLCLLHLLALARYSRGSSCSLICGGLAGSEAEPVYRLSQVEAAAGGKAGSKAAQPTETPDVEGSNGVGPKHISHSQFGFGLKLISSAVLKCISTRRPRVFR